MKKYQFSKKKQKKKKLPSLDSIQVCCPKTNENVFFLNQYIYGSLEETLRVLRFSKKKYYGPDVSKTISEGFFLLMSNENYKKMDVIRTRFIIKTYTSIYWYTDCNNSLVIERCIYRFELKFKIIIFSWPYLIVKRVIIFKILANQNMRVSFRAS